MKGPDSFMIIFLEKDRLKVYKSKFEIINLKKYVVNEDFKHPAEEYELHLTEVFV